MSFQQGRTVAAGPHRGRVALASGSRCAGKWASWRGVRVSILFGKKSLNVLSYYQPVTETCIRTGIRTQTKELLRLLPLPLGYTDSA